MWAVVGRLRGDGVKTCIKSIVHFFIIFWRFTSVSPLSFFICFCCYVRYRWEKCVPEKPNNLVTEKKPEKCVFCCYFMSFIIYNHFCQNSVVTTHPISSKWGEVENVLEIKAEDLFLAKRCLYQSNPVYSLSFYKCHFWSYATKDVIQTFMVSWSST